MAAANIGMIENVISTAVNTQYKDVPPTEEQFKALADSMRASMAAMFPVTDEEYFNHKEDGLRVIAVGGNSLSRGLTLEGLGVSYFYRKSQMYDTAADLRPIPISEFLRQLSGSGGHAGAGGGV